ncbi:hypothetical protein D3C87_1998570 [compost metagenome]
MPRSWLSTDSAAARPSSFAGWCTVDSGGSQRRAQELSSKPTMPTSRGMTLPAACSTSIAPAATASLEAKTPSMSGARSSSARMPFCPS